MKKAIILLIPILLLLPITIAADANQTNTSTTIQQPTSSVISTLKWIYDFLISINPILLLILGIILLLASKFARFVAIILIIVAVIHILLILI